MQSDPVADMLTRIRNASRARLARTEVPYSALKVKLAEVLKAEGFIDDFRHIAGRTAGHGIVEIKLRYDDKKEPVIGGLRRLSTSGMRKYLGCDEIPKIRGGLGVVILTTPKGIMTDRQARKERVGGEALCAVW